MSMCKKRLRPKITDREIHRRVVKRLTGYGKLNLLERFALFMGKAQVLEFGLKSLLARRYKYDPDEMEKWTLGWTTKELKKCGLRSDYIELLEVVVGYRNFVAHEALANVAMLNILSRGNIGRLGIKHLDRGIYELERVILLQDWCEKHDAWKASPSLPAPAPIPAQESATP
jgi:hypothetical protein